MDSRKFRLRTVSLAIGLAIPLAVATPAVAFGGDGAEDTASIPMRADVAEPLPSPYVQADSPAEAQALFEAIDNQPLLRAASVTYGPCTLYPSVMYLRKSSGYRDVGTKPYTKCTVPVTSIRHSTDLRYKSFIWWKKAGSTTRGGNSGVASYTQRDVSYRCVSDESTGWSGTTAGTIVYAGKTYYARVYQPVKTLDCGG